MTVATAPAPPRAPARRSPTATALTAAGAVVLLLVLVLAVWAVVALLGLRSAAATATDRVRDVEAGVSTGQTSAALAAVRSAAASTRTARERADALPLRLASHLPVVGEPLARSRALVAATDTAVRRGAVPLLGVADDLAGDGGRGVLRADGSVDLDRLQRAAAVAERAAEATRAAEASAAAIDPTSLPGPLAAPAQAAREGIGRLAVSADRAGAALGASPALMGSQGPQAYLLLPGEPPTTGDGSQEDATLVLVVDDGRAHLTAPGPDGAATSATTADAVLHVGAPDLARATSAGTGTAAGRAGSTAALLAPLVDAARHGRLGACSRHADLQVALQRAGVSEPGAGLVCR